MKLTSRFVTVLCLLALGSGCAAKSKSSSPPGYDMAMPEMAAEAMPMEAEATMGAEASVDDAATPSADPGLTTTPATIPSGGVLGMVPHRKPAQSDGDKAIAGGESDPGPQTIGDDSVERLIVFTGAMSLRVEHGTAPSMIDAAADLAVTAGGYVAQQTDTSLQLRVPSRRFRLVMRNVQELGELQSRSVQTLDVTEEFHDLGVRLKNLQATRTRIQHLLDQAKDLDEILKIEQELRRVSAEIDQLEGRLRYLGSHSAFSTINLAFSERTPEVTMVEPEPGEQLPPPPPPPPRTLDTSVEWVGEIDVHRLMRLDMARP